MTIRAWGAGKRCSSCISTLLLGGTLVALSGCAVGPNYHPPQTPVAAAFAGGNQTNLSVAEPVVDWWRGFQDEELDQLVDRAVTGNHDLRIATANLLEARALRLGTRFDLLPSLNANPSYTDTQFSKAAMFNFPVPDRHLELYDAGFDATWELDLFGRVRRSLEAATANVQEAAAHRRDMLVSLISEVARNYFELRGAQNRLAVAHQNADNQRETVQITQARLDGGRGTELDLARARAQLDSTLASIPPLETVVARAIHRLSVLTGQPPTALTAELERPSPIPTLPALVAIGSPDSLLRRRPDIRAAERALAAATARIGVATADLFPRVTFVGNMAFQATRLSGLGQEGSDAYAFGPGITWAAFDLGHVRARIRAADTRAEAALANYQRTVLTSLEETEDSLVEFDRERARRDYLRASAQASQTAAQLARERYDNGATDFLTVLDAERVLYAAQDQLADSRTRTATALIAVYKSLGGGWEIEHQDPGPSHSARRILGKAAPAP
ncbi:MAG: efflux transporter outer membrane subunit [Verrucomicrobia bacterium]|nr:efflux transporter outer membrane subunit [Verrucomicrobiota bacterium]